MDKPKIRQLIGANGLDEAINELLKATEHTHHHNDVLLQSTRLNEYKSQQIKRTESSDDLNRLRNQIANALLSIVDDFSEEDETIVAKLTKKKGCSMTVSIAFAATLIAILGGIAEFSGYSLRDIFSSSNGKLINVSVYVEDKNSDLVAALKKEAYVLMTTEGGGRAKELIDDKSRASFQNIRVGDKVSLNVDFSEPYRPVKPDSIYTVPADGRITLTVALQNLNRIFGTVLYRDHFLEGVLVDVEGLRDTTDLTGRFEIFIPENQQHQSPEVKFIKKGFKDKIVKSYPQTKEPLNVVMEK